MGRLFAILLIVLTVSGPAFGSTPDLQPLDRLSRPSQAPTFMPDAASDAAAVEQAWTDIFRNGHVMLSREQINALYNGARRGNLSAQYLLGIARLNGIGIPADPQDAAAHLS